MKTVQKQMKEMSDMCSIKKSFFSDEFITHIHITNGQIKSLEKAKKIVDALEIIEEEMGI